MSEQLTPAQLDQIAATIQDHVCEGYPALEHRLYLGAAGLRLSGTTLVVPEGPWYISCHSNRLGVDHKQLDPEVPSEGYPTMPAEVAARLRQNGVTTTDQYGRPIHPDWQQLLGDRRIGLPTGLGLFYRYEANSAARGALSRRHRITDPVQLLLVQRAGTEQWGLPGGFFDPQKDKSLEIAARRETAEETGLDETQLNNGEIIVRRRSIGVRTTLHAWSENTVVLLHGDRDYLFEATPTVANDPDQLTIAAHWFTQTQTETLKVINSQRSDINLAFRHLERAA